jgi:thiol-disulfide isomerase/thioredoxin/archaellum component FlaF (FlaF/FlaG flagellin family)
MLLIIKIITMKYLAIALLITHSFCNATATDQVADVAAARQIISDSVFTLANKTKQKISFVYYDKFGNIVQFSVDPLGSKSIQLDSFMALTQPNTYQNNYLITKGDTINIHLNASNNAVLLAQSDTAENKNLNIATYINEKLQYGAMELGSLIALKKLQYRAVDSIIMGHYLQQLTLLNEYDKKVGISENARAYFELDFKSALLNYKFYIGQKYKSQLSAAYQKQLDSLNNELDILYGSKFANRNGNLRISFLAYKYAQPNKPIANETLYTYCKDGAQNKAADEAKFWVVKNELQRNKKSTKWFISDFKNNSPNKELVDYVVSLQANNEIIYNTKGNNSLLSLDGRKYSYDSLIKSYAGHVLYIDFWASWCAPCRANMGASHQLKATLKGKKFVALYFSIDENIQSWKKANKDEGLGMKESFLLLNAQNTSLIKNFKIHSIPRYLLIGKDGKVLNDNAPAPNDASLMATLTKLL